MKIAVVPAAELDAGLTAAWERIVSDAPGLASPFFRPEFIRALATVRDVRVAVLEDGRQSRGFFPFEQRWKLGRPAGDPLSDFHGVIAPPGLDYGAAELVRGCGLASWRFNHLLAPGPSFGQWTQNAVPSPYLDISQGFEAYQTAKTAEGSHEVRRVLQSARTAQRQAGPLRFVYHTADRAVFESLIQWKSEQYRRTGADNAFDAPWVVPLLRRIHETQHDDFAGILSALYFGDRLAAVHLGMRSRHVFHYWFPAYHPTFASHSPGRICLLELVRAAACRGLRRFDLGKGTEDYKLRLASAADAVFEGTVLCGRGARALDWGRRAGQSLKRLPWVGAAARWAARVSRPLRRRLLQA